MLARRCATCHQKMKLRVSVSGTLWDLVLTAILLSDLVPRYPAFLDRKIGQSNADRVNHNIAGESTRRDDNADDDDIHLERIDGVVTPMVSKFLTLL